ncbi:thrombospondin type 3 repeat-containing protein [Methylomonas sp. LL1]|nr:thrombospondin type 3 repeat-containing protein [Methylomonas sp. LL1]
MTISIRHFQKRHSIKRMGARLIAALLLTVGFSAHSATNALIVGDIERLTLDDPNDHWSGGLLIVGGQSIILPRNLLIDLPANRLTLQQIFEQAPANCKAASESGLAKADGCSGGNRGFATIHANRTNAGNLIAGDVFLEKGTGTTSGVVSYIDHSDGYLRINGLPNDPKTGVMLRLNDPDGRHSIQQGLGCKAGAPNCSADPRFSLDSDNYVVVFSTGMPACIPSTKARSFADVLDLNRNGITTETLTAQSLKDGTGDLLCPETNRSINGGQPVDDSRRFAPIRVGDHLNASGNFESVNGVQFLSVYKLTLSKALGTKNDPTQPDYVFLSEVGIDAMGFQNQRARALFIGFSTLSPGDVDYWSVHYDPGNNEPHKFPLASVRGCDLLNGQGMCTRQGIGLGINGGGDIIKIKYDVDFLFPSALTLSPCAQLTAGGYAVCPFGGRQAEEFAILSPIPREIFARTGHGMKYPELITLDIAGNQTSNGQYLFPLGLGLGGITAPEFVEINLDKVGTPFIFAGLPWTLDRRLSPGGCIDSNNDGNPDCESSPQPLDPYPFSGLDPRTQANIPGSFYPANNFYNASPLSNVQNRVLSYVDPAVAKFNGNYSVLKWPPVDPAEIPVEPPVPVIQECSALDSDHDGIDDGSDNCLLIANPDQRDTDGDGFGNACDTDLNNDQISNNLDTGILKSVYLCNSVSNPGIDSCDHADFNGDGVVNNLDVGISKQYYLLPPGP